VLTPRASRGCQVSGHVASRRLLPQRIPTSSLSPTIRSCTRPWLLSRQAIWYLREFLLPNAIPGPAIGGVVPVPPPSPEPTPRFLFPLPAAIGSQFQCRSCWPSYAFGPPSTHGVCSEQGTSPVQGTPLTISYQVPAGHLAYCHFLHRPPSVHIPFPPPH
jgi:hypothetical protein